MQGLRRRAPPLGERLERRELGGERLDQRVKVGQRVPVGVEPPVEAAVVAEEGDADALLLARRRGAGRRS
jgi:hypothetical protein